MTERGLPAEPIAIIGIGCRLPGGADSPAALWQLLIRGGNAIVPVPQERWDAKAIFDTRRDSPGKTWAREAGFVDGIDQFDAHLFGLSPREAAALDPQTRMTMEVAYQALEDAGQAPGARSWTTGVFMGISGSDYQAIQLADRRSIDGYVALGTAASIAANRISHALDLHGPSLAVDTACSSSLVAVHLAAQSLHSRESDLALAGGVGLLLRPEMTIAFSKGFMLAPDMRCKSFDARANGFVRGEGAGVVVLKRLADALAERDRIYAVILATAVNQDGFTPQGIAVPNQRAQEAQIEVAYRRAGVSPAEVHYIETHGPGTPVGDPIEAGALGNVLGRGRAKENPLLLGSIKTNIGHLEPAAGIAGLIKAALSLHYQAIAPNINFEEPSPAIDFAGLSLRIPTQVEPWTAGAKRRIAGVNSFGFGGTNAHVVLTGAELAEAEAPKAQPEVHAPGVLPISAASQPALAALVGAYAAQLAAQPEATPELIRGAAVRRAQHAHRVAVVGSDRPALLAGLANWRELATHAHAKRRLAFVFSGMGGQWWGMARDLLTHEPVFRHAIEKLDGLIMARAGWSLLSEFLAPEESNRLTHDFVVGQPAVFALQVAVAALWRSLGVEPTEIVGHSVGEIAAAHIAGAITQTDAVDLVISRSELQARHAGQGAMVAIPWERQRVLPYLNSRVSIAVVNSPESTVLAGARDDLEAIVAQLSGHGVAARWLAVPFPAHSPLMEQAKHSLVAHLKDLRPSAPAISMYSTVTGRRVEGITHDAEYWGENTRAPVLFLDALQGLVDVGVDAFVEIGPHPVLVYAIGELGGKLRKNLVALPSLRRDRAAGAVLRESLAKLWSVGCEVDWQRAYGLGPALELPRYPLQRETFWRESEVSRRARHPRIEHPLLGARAPGPQTQWTIDLARAELAYLEDHSVQGSVILPAAAFAEMALAAGEHLLGQDSVCLEQVRLLAAMFIDSESPAEVRTVVLSDGPPRLAISSQRAPGDPWTLHCQLSVKRAERPRQTRLALDSIRARCTQPMEAAAFYEKLTRMGDNFGPRFKGVRRLLQGRSEVLAEIEVPTELIGQLDSYRAHPVIIDSLFQSLVANFEVCEEYSCLPVSIERLTVYAPLRSTKYISYAHIIDRHLNGTVGELYLTDLDGNVLVEVSGFAFCALESVAARHATRSQLLWHDVWKKAPALEATTKLAGAWLIVGSQGGTAGTLARVLGNHGVSAAVLPADAGSEVRRRLEAAAPEPSAVVCGVVFVAEAELPGDLSLLVQESCAALHLVQSLAAEPLRGNLRLFWVTQGARSAALHLAGAAISGLARVVENEHPELRSTLVELDGTAASIAALAVELLADSPEDELRLTGEGRYFHRVEQVKRPMVGKAGALSRAWVEHLGAHTRIAILAAPLPQPGPGQVLVELRTAALAQWDAYRMSTGSGSHQTGCIAVGTIIAVGEGVELRSIAERVIVIGHGLCATHAVVPSRFTAPVAEPSDRELSAESALAALAATILFAEVASSARVATVGGTLAMRRACAVAARQRGATIVHDPASAKRDFDAVFQLTSPADLTRIARLIRPNGQLLTLGPAVLDHAVLSAALSSGLRLWQFDLGHWLDEAAPQLSTYLQEAAKMLPLDEVHEEAARVAHPGLLSSEPFHDPVMISTAGLRPDAMEPLALPADATYLIVGGLGGFGRRVAEWLVACGARHLALIARSGANTSEKLAVIQRLKCAGCRVSVLPVDVTDKAELTRTFEQIRQTMPPLRGVFHSAMVLEDSTIGQLAAEGLQRVLAPKMSGAWNLHELTVPLPLEHFILFSSTASLIGQPGQAAYAAANAFLDGLALLRRAQGLPGLSIGWGVLGGAGYVAERDGVRAHLERMGLTPIPLHTSLALLGDLMQADLDVVSACSIDWRRWARANANGLRPRLGGLNRIESSTAQPETWQQALHDSVAEERLPQLLGGLTERVAKILGTKPSALKSSDSLGELGLDSLMAVELRNRLRQDLGLDLPTLTFLQGPTLEQLADKLLARLFHADTMRTAPGAESSAGAKHSAVGAPRLAWFTRGPSALTTPARARLFCFPYNGGGISSFGSWTAGLDGVDVVSLKLPGWRDRPDEAPSLSFAQLVEQTVEVMAPWLDRPYILYGHSLGGRLAFEVASALEAAGLPPPAAVIVGACHAPMLPSPFPTDVSALLAQSMDQLGMSSVLKPALEDPELMQSLIAALRNGLNVLASWRHQPERMLSCPLVAVYGDKDPLVRLEHLRGWETLTTGTSAIEVISGGHLFVDTARTATLALVKKHLAQVERAR